MYVFKFNGEPVNQLVICRLNMQQQLIYVTTSKNLSYQHSKLSFCLDFCGQPKIEINNALCLVSGNFCRVDTEYFSDHYSGNAGLGGAGL